MPRPLPIFTAVILLTAAAGCERQDPANTGVVGPSSNNGGGPPPSAFEFAPAWNGLPESGMWKCDPVFADFNNDGHLDLCAIPRLGNGPYMWLGDGAGNWTDSSDGLKPGTDSCGGGLFPIDINGDGNLDLAVADHCNGVYFYVGNGDGQFLMTTRAMHPGIANVSGDERSELVGAEDIAAGDVNGDGHVDLVVGSSDDAGINVYHGDGTGLNWEHQPRTVLPQKAWCLRVILHDMDGDGDLDIVASAADGPRVWKNDGTGNWIPYSGGLPEPTMRGLFQGLAVGDINEDGRPDIAVANWVNGPEVFLQHPAGGWTRTEDVFPELRGGSQGVALGDVDGDGHLDLVTSGRMDPDVSGCVRGIFALKGDGLGGFSWQANSGLPETGLAGMAGVGMGDVNGDGFMDVALGTGLIVETGPRKEPVIAHRLPVWIARPASGGGMSGASAKVP